MVVGLKAWVPCVNPHRPVNPAATPHQVPLPLLYTSLKSQPIKYLILIDPKIKMLYKNT